MDPIDLEAALKAAFNQCEFAGSPLNEFQKQILLQILERFPLLPGQVATEPAQEANPLDQLTPQERQIFLEYVAACDPNRDAWKINLLDDWLQNRDSGPVQFIRDRYGMQWLNQIQPVHLAAYAETSVRLKVGDRIEVCNSLWEWIPATSSSNREWYSAVVIQVFESADSERACSNCTIRLENGLEYDIYGVYDWNRPHWRWPPALEESS